MAADIVGIVPAAGTASRLGTIPCSKEIFPVAYREDGSGRPQPVPACEPLIDKLRLAGARRIFIVLRQGKWDIPAYLGDGDRLGVSLAYLMMRIPFGQAYSVDAARAFVRGATVLLGFPDILFDRHDVYVRLLERKEASGADVVLGLCPVDTPERADLVRTDSAGRVTGLEVKPVRTELTHTWLTAAWSPDFTDFLHAHAERILADVPTDSVPEELYIGNVLQAALALGMSIESVTFPEARYIDIGTPEDLAKAVGARILPPVARDESGRPLRQEAP